MDIKLDLSTIMMILFIVAFIISMWKIYPFLQTTTLQDDDTTPQAQEELLKIILKYVDTNEKEMDTIDTKELLEKIKNDKDFDKEHFWRLNQNKLNNILKGLNQG